LSREPKGKGRLLQILISRDFETGEPRYSRTAQRVASGDVNKGLARCHSSQRKGGPGITRSDLLVINKIDLAPLVGANLEVMERDALRMRVKRPFIFTNLKSGEGVDQIAGFVIEKGGLAKSAA
jgi:hypothetical protein